MDAHYSGHPSSPANPAHAAPPKRRIWVWIAVIAVFVLAFYWIWHHRGNPAQAASSSRRMMMGGPVTLNVAVAKKGDIGVYVNAIGTVTPVYTSTITSQVNGVISVVHYKESQIVHKGDPLLDIDPRPYQAMLTQAEGTLERDTNIMAQSRMDLERYRAAWSRNAIAKQTLDDQEKIVLQNEGTVKNDQGVVDYDKVQLGYCHITAPFDGRVGLRLVDPGNVVQANSTTALVVITQLDPITIIFTVAQGYLGEIESEWHSHAALEVDAYDYFNIKKIATGKLLAIDNQIDTTTGTVRLRAQFNNKNNQFFPNQFVNTRLLVNTMRGVTLIPSSTIQHNGATAFVYVISGGAAHIKNIKPGTEEGGLTAVPDLSPGDQVAASSFEKLQDNAKVTIVSTPLPASSTSESNAP